MEKCQWKTLKNGDMKKTNHGMKQNLNIRKNKVETRIRQWMFLWQWCHFGLEEKMHYSLLCKNTITTLRKLYKNQKYF